MIDHGGRSVSSAEVIRRLLDHHNVEPVRPDGVDGDVDIVCRRLRASAAVAGIRIRTERTDAHVNVRYLGPVPGPAQVLLSMNVPPAY